MADNNINGTLLAEANHEEESTVVPLQKQKMENGDSAEDATALLLSKDSSTAAATTLTLADAETPTHPPASATAVAATTSSSSSSSSISPAPSSPMPAALHASASSSNSNSSISTDGGGDEGGNLRSRRNPNEARRRAAEESSNVRSAAHWDGEFALSVLGARPRDEATGRRKSTKLVGDDVKSSAAASAVGAFVSKSDQELDDARKKKMEKEERARRHSMNSHDSGSTFDERLRRKLEESRTGADRRRRSSSMASFASSIGSNNFESIDEGQQAKFSDEKIDEVFDRIEEGRQEEGTTTSAAVANMANGSSSSPGNLKSPPELNDIDSYHTRKSITSPTRNASMKSVGSTSSHHHRRPSQGSAAEEYEDFITKKISARMDVGMTYSERKRREAEEVAAAAAASAESATECSREQIPQSQSFSRQAAPSHDHGEEIMAAEVQAASGQSSPRSSTQGQPTTPSEDEEALLSAAVHAASGGQAGQHVVCTKFPSYQPAPRVRDEEEEKVELSSEDDAVPPEDPGEQKEEERATLTAACAAVTAADIEDDIDVKEKESKPYVDTKIPLSDAPKRPTRPSVGRISRSADNSPFSSMVAERERMKIVTSYDSDPEDMLDSTDCPPDVVTDVLPSSRANNNRRRSAENNALSGSFTLTMVDRLVRRSSNEHRTRSDHSMNARSNTSDQMRRGTYAFGTHAEARSSALRELADLVEAQDVVQATLVVENDMPIETVEAIPMDDEEDARERKRQRLKKQILLVWGPVVLILAVIAVAIVVIESRKDNFDNDDVESVVGSPKVQIYDPTLVQVRKEGVLRCGVPNKYGFAAFNEDTGETHGMSADFCKAVAAAVLGPEYQVNLIEVTSITRFTALAGREIDLLIWGDTHTMERDFHEKASGVGFQFTDPYFYDGLGFAGQPHAVQCADNSNWLGECGDLKICVNAGTTHVDVLKHIFPLPNLVPRDTKELFLEEFVNGGCNVIAGEQNDISEVVVRMAGYEGDFINGEQVLSKEPLAMVTRKNDQSWTDIANWVLRALIHAEMTNITQITADELQRGHHSSHGHAPITSIDLVAALKAAGNYGEIYARNMQEVVPRKGLNLLYAANDENQSGLRYSHPTGTIDTFRHEFASDGKISQIFGRGKLLCGILGDETQSMESDYCRALSASLFSSDTSRVEFVKLSNEDDLMENLHSGEVDVIAGAAVNFDSDVVPSNETASGLSGLAFSQPYFYGGDSPDLFHQESSEPKAMATSQTDADWSTFVYWVVANLIWAEENNLTSADFREVPEVKLFGENFEWMFQGSILGIGNYGEIYERNLESLPPRANQNLLNDGSSPQIWHPQF